jgi:endonuclease YncB( thermonuclease family)
VLLATTALIVVTSATYTESFSGKVVGMVDGDTINVLHHERAERVRLAALRA